jgi:hypothetical protein
MGTNALMTLALLCRTVRRTLTLDEVVMSCPYAARSSLPTSKLISSNHAKIVKK